MHFEQEFAGIYSQFNLPGLQSQIYIVLEWVTSDEYRLRQSLLVNWLRRLTMLTAFTVVVVMANIILLDFGSEIISRSRMWFWNYILLEDALSVKYRLEQSLLAISLKGLALLTAVVVAVVWTEQGWLLTVIVVAVVWREQSRLGSDLPQFTPLQGSLRCPLHTLLSGRPFVLLVFWHIILSQHSEVKTIDKPRKTIASLTYNVHQNRFGANIQVLQSSNTRPPWLVLLFVVTGLN